MIIKPKPRNAGDKSVAEPEEVVTDLSFHVHKFNNRPKPSDPRRNLVICCFSEFGCEVLGAMYCIPRVLRRHAGKYTIVAGWHGRAHLYRHLVDEFWEVQEQHQWLREYCRAFHHESANLYRLERSLAAHGCVLKSKELGRFALSHECPACNHFWNGERGACPKCGGTDPTPSLFSATDYWRDRATFVPTPTPDKVAAAAAGLGLRPVGVVARGRKCYGRNLPPEFYIRLISLLRGRGLSPVWLGERQSTQPCPVPDVPDLSRAPSARDLEFTLAVIKNLSFTIQFWTASTRLASMVGTPYILFESPDQIWGAGQEGYRRRLCDFSPCKLVAAQFQDVLGDPDAGLRLAGRAVDEVLAGDFGDLYDPLGNEAVSKSMSASWHRRIGQHGNPTGSKEGGGKGRVLPGEVRGAQRPDGP